MIQTKPVAVKLPPQAFACDQSIMRGVNLLRAFTNCDRDTVRSLAWDYLRMAQLNPHCRNSGNAIHQANTVLGLIALEDEEVDRAADYLTASALTPGSTQLFGFGPNMLLAQKLLLRGRKQVVLTYLDLCSTFWKLSFGRLWLWKTTIRWGRTPSFGSNLTHLIDPKSYG